MIFDFKNKIKSATPSLRSVKSNKNEESFYASPHQNVSTASSVHISGPASSPPPPPPAHISPSHLSSRRQEKTAVNTYTHRNVSKTHTASSNSSSSSSLFSISMDRRHRNSNHSLDDATPVSSSSTASSSTASISIPATPPIFAANYDKRSSVVSLPISISNEYFMNHDHLKPGRDAELLAYDKTISLYRENAKKTNDPAIQCELATFLYESSKNANTKPEERQAYVTEAIKMLKSLAVRGYPESQYYLANIYASGGASKTGKPDFGNAFPLFLQAAKHHNTDAAYRVARCYESGLGCLKSKAKAVQFYKVAATLNHPGAMYKIGLADINGSLGLQRNIRNGNKWLKRSADAATPEYPHALHELGLLHEKGLGGIIFRDSKYSLQLYARASELGYAPSACRLGECFEYSYLGCAKDAASSIYYYTIAANQGNPEACFALSAWYLVGGKDIKPSEAKAVLWAQRAAEKGLSKAEFALGYFAEVGIGRPKDLNEAMSWYQKAASQGNEQAHKRLANSSLSLSTAAHTGRQNTITSKNNRTTVNNNHPEPKSSHTRIGSSRKKLPVMPSVLVVGGESR